MNHTKLFLSLCLSVAAAHEVSAYIRYQDSQAAYAALRKQKRDLCKDIYNGYADTLFDTGYSREIQDVCSRDILDIMEQASYNDLKELYSVIYALSKECFLDQVYKKAYTFAEQESYKYALSNKQELVQRIAQEEKKEAEKRAMYNDKGSLRYIYTDLKNRIADKIKSAAQAESAAAKRNAESAASAARNVRQ